MKSKYYFYLNPHDEYAWTKCPKCDNSTKVRKYCLMIHYEEKSQNYRQLFSLNKTCKFCPYCELIIGKKSEIESLLQQILTQLGKGFNPEHYFVFGTMDRKDWKKGQKEHLHPGKVLNLAYRFKDIWDFKIRPAGWYREDEL